MSKLFTEETRFLHLNQRLEYSTELAKKINIAENTLRAYPNWYFYNDDFYYYKKVYTDKDILNHLICEKVANFFNILTAHFQLAKVNNNIGITSKNFREPNCDYISGGIFSKSTNLLYVFQEFELRFCSNNILHNQLMSDIFRLIAFHIYTNLDDICRINLLFKETKNSFSLDYSFDYDQAFDYPITNKNILDSNNIIENEIRKMTYESCICIFTIPSIDFDKILASYPFFADYLKLFLDVNMDEILKEIIDEYKLFLDSYHLDHYKEQDEIKKEFIRSLHL